MGPGAAPSTRPSGRDPDPLPASEPPSHHDPHRAARRARRAPPGPASGARARGRASVAAVATAAALALCLALSGPGLAQERTPIDLEPPLIEHEVLAEADAAERQSFVAQVVDDRELASVRLFWRLAGDEVFEPVPMARVSSSSTWIAQVPTEPGDDRRIEYWIEARDAGGNRTVRGFAFSPLVRRIVPAGRAPAAGPGRPREARSGEPARTGSPESGSDGRRTLWAVLGTLGVVLLVGLASSGGDGGGGGGGGEPEPPGDCGDDGCEVTITFGPPVTP